MNPRFRRLVADYQSVCNQYTGHPYVIAEPVGPTPPEVYRVTYRLPGLRLLGDRPTPIGQHDVELRLPLGYPREAPACIALTPLFHPNVSDHYCISDYWAAGEPLADVIAKVGDMIQWRIYNTKSPLDAVAAYWAEEHPELFPVGEIELGQPEPAIQLLSAGARSGESHG